MSRSLTLLGATGSIGASTLDLVRRNPDEWRIDTLTAAVWLWYLRRMLRAASIHASERKGCDIPVRLLRLMNLTNDVVPIWGHGHHRPSVRQERCQESA